MTTTHSDIQVIGNNLSVTVAPEIRGPLRTLAAHTGIGRVTALSASLVRMPSPLICRGAGLAHPTTQIGPDQPEPTAFDACDTRTDQLAKDHVTLVCPDELVAERASQRRLPFSRGRLRSRLGKPRAHRVTP